MDANSKSGPNLIQKDPHCQSSNGKILENIIEKHDLIVVNNLEICSGSITRKRTTVNGVEESIIDLVLISRDLLEIVEHLLIEENKDHALTRISKNKGKVVVKESDHNSLISRLNVVWRREMKKERFEVYNLKNLERQSKFKALTSTSNVLSSVFDQEEDLNIACKKFMKRLKGCIVKSFKKIRIKPEQCDPEVNIFFEKKKIFEK